MTNEQTAIYIKASRVESQKLHIEWERSGTDLYNKPGTVFKARIFLPCEKTRAFLIFLPAPANSRSVAKQVLIRSLCGHALGVRDCEVREIQI